MEARHTHILTYAYPHLHRHERTHKYSHTHTCKHTQRFTYAQTQTHTYAQSGSVEGTRSPAFSAISRAGYPPAPHSTSGASTSVTHQLHPPHHFGTPPPRTRNTSSLSTSMPALPQLNTPSTSTASAAAQREELLSHAAHTPTVYSSRGVGSTPLSMPQGPSPSRIGPLQVSDMGFMCVFMGTRRAGYPLSITISELPILCPLE